MSLWHDIVDWVGGHPFAVAKPDEIFEFYKARGYSRKNDNLRWWARLQ